MALRNAHRSAVSNVFLNGFLPVVDPQLCLPNESECTLNLELNLTMHQLTMLLKEKKLRLIIDALNKKHSATPLIRMDHFNPAEVNAGFAMLTTLVQAYVWEDRNQPARMIPRILAENLFNLMNVSPRMPVLTYADYVLYNWQRIDKNKPITLDNIEPIFTFTDSKEEAWFIKIHVAIEAALADAIAASGCIHALAAAPYEGNPSERFSKHFTTMASSIERAATILDRMYEQCTPAFFFNELRPYLEGTEKAKGIQFDLPGHQNQIYFYRGSSGAQSSTVPALDAILNVQHENDQMTKSLQAFLDYMPAAHKQFILHLKENKVKAVLSEFKEVAKQCGEAINQLTIFRSKHLGMPAKYITQQAREQGIPLEKVTGTGSTNIGMFLGKRTVETEQAAIKVGWKPEAKL